MKSNEEFIAGIYEKAASYTEENETKIIRVNFAAKAARMAAMVAVCLGLAGIGAMMMESMEKVPDGSGNEEIALLSETGFPLEGRAIPELTYLEGKIEQVNQEEQQILLRLHGMDMEKNTDSKGVLVLVSFSEDVNVIEKLCEGMQIKVGGATLTKSRMEELGYLNELADFMLTVTREQDFFVWSEESGEYIRPNYGSDENE